MNEHEIGREVQELGSRLERIEASLRVKPGYGGVNGDRGSSRYHKSSGGVAEKKPVEWKLKKGDPLPPLLSSLMRLPHLPVSKFDDPPQSKTWSASPEPLILIVNWSGGGSDEFFRLVNQTFSVTKWTDPNTGVESAVETYAATRIASGRAHTVVGQSAANFQLILREARWHASRRLQRRVLGELQRKRPVPHLASVQSRSVRPGDGRIVEFKL